jgi:large subunit ribosomal protein L3
MKGIVGKKRGMTQIFDPDSGGVTSVTVIEAGPCPVVQLKTEETDGYDAIQLAYEPVAPRKITKAEAGHLRKSEVEPHRHLVEFRGETPFVVGESVSVEAFEPGVKIKVTGI